MQYLKFLHRSVWMNFLIFYENDTNKLKKLYDLQ